MFMCVFECVWCTVWRAGWLSQWLIRRAPSRQRMWVWQISPFPLLLTCQPTQLQDVLEDTVPAYDKPRPCLLSSRSSHLGLLITALFSAPYPLSSVSSSDELAQWDHHDSYSFWKVRPFFIEIAHWPCRFSPSLYVSLSLSVSLVHISCKIWKETAMWWPKGVKLTAI